MSILNNVNEQKLISELEYKIKMLTAFIDGSEAGLYVTDYETCNILYVNRKMLSFGNFAHNVDELVGTKCWKTLDPNATGRCSFCPYQKLVSMDGTPLDPYVWEHFFEDYGVWLRVINQAIVWVDGRLAHMVTFHDITESKLLQQRLAHLAFMDSQLGLRNAVRLEHDIRDSSVAPSLIILDIESLRKVNYAYGRTLGDKLLKAVSDYILKLRFPGSLLYRIGGDEFCLTVPSCSENETASFANTLLQRFQRPWVFEEDGNKIHLFTNASVGVILADYVKSADSLLNLVERTLFETKKNQCVTIYNDTMDNSQKQQLKLELSLKRSVRESMDGFEVLYQPIVDSETSAWCGLEALCRWNSVELGYVSPIVFIPEAERLALIGKIGLWVLETAVSQCKRWGLDRETNFCLNVNVSAVQFSEEALAANVLDILHKFDYPGSKLCLEITESTQFTFTNLSLSTIRLLRSHNILFALDDFGTGYANFSNLKNLPVDFVKIEREFTADIEKNTYHKFLFEAITGITHSADKRLVAEGVENNKQMTLLVESQADFLQGYLFSKPLSSKMLESRLDCFQAV